MNSTGGITSRSKYKVDPSVQSSPLYNQYGFNNPSSQSYGGYNSPLPDPYTNTSIPAYNPANPAPGQINPLPGQLNPVPGAMNATVNPTMAGGYYNPAQAAPEPVAPPVQPKPAAPGWNDPPMMTSKPKVSGSFALDFHQYILKIFIDKYTIYLFIDISIIYVIGSKGFYY